MNYFNISDIHERGNFLLFFKIYYNNIFIKCTETDDSVPLWIIALFLNVSNSFHGEEVVMGLCFIFYFLFLSNIELLETKTS